MNENRINLTKHNKNVKGVIVNLKFAILKSNLIPLSSKSRN